jgi:hypothetical protein
MTPIKDDAHAGDELKEWGGGAHQLIPLLFGLVWAALIAPFALVGFRASLNYIGLVAGVIAAAITFGYVIKEIGRSNVDRRVARHLLITMWLPYLVGAACAYYAHRFDDPWFRDTVLGKPLSVDGAVGGFWSMWPSVALHSAVLAGFMGISGSLLRWAQDGDLRARVVGEWLGIGIGAVAALAHADHSYVERALTSGAIQFMRHEGRIESAVECVRSNGSLVREQTDCVGAGSTRECDSYFVGVPCDPVVAARDLKGIYGRRLIDVARSDPRVLEDNEGLGDVLVDCTIQHGEPLARQMLPAELCREVEANLHGGESMKNLLVVHWTCVVACATKEPLERASDCSRECVQKELPWVPTSAFEHRSRFEAQWVAAASRDGGN